MFAHLLFKSASGQRDFGIFFVETVKHNDVDIQICNPELMVLKILAMPYIIVTFWLLIQSVVAIPVGHLFSRHVCAMAYLHWGSLGNFE